MTKIDIQDPKQLGVFIREIRKKLKIPQAELADFSGLHRNGIAKVESGETDVKLSTLLKISELLQLKLSIESEE